MAKKTLDPAPRDGQGFARQSSFTDPLLRAAEVVTAAARAWDRARLAQYDKVAARARAELGHLSSLCAASEAARVPLLAAYAALGSARRSMEDCAYIPAAAAEVDLAWDLSQAAAHERAALWAVYRQRMQQRLPLEVAQQVPTAPPGLFSSWQEVRP